MQAYLARLQNLAGEKPLVMAEIGLDSMSHGEVKQAETLNWQVRTAFASGCAGAFVFSWTDEWHRGGCDIEDWAFGLTDRDRRPKPALEGIGKAYADAPFPRDRPWPKISVVVCTYNGSRTLKQCCEGLLKLDYPDYEVIVVNDGSTDSTASIAGQLELRYIGLSNGGLSNARNVGLKAAAGEIVAYLDDDACPDPQWLRYLADAFETGGHVGIGGPNIAPAGDGLVADCVANAPGGPIHVLLDDVKAEHIPGCNMAFRKECLDQVGGFDTQFCIAGDDVDLCWSLQEKGWSLGYSPAALVWHHRRNSVRAYWKQQVNYGRAEAMLERKWPQKYNVAGHVPWVGRIYGTGVIAPLVSLRSRIYHGTWGSAPFQSLYEPAPGLLSSLPMMPEWYMITGGLAFLSALGLLWTPLRWTFPLLCIAVVIPPGPGQSGRGPGRVQRPEAGPNAHRAASAHDASAPDTTDGPTLGPLELRSDAVAAPGEYPVSSAPPAHFRDLERNLASR